MNLIYPLDSPGIVYIRKAKKLEAQMNIIYPLAIEKFAVILSQELACICISIYIYKYI